MAAFGDLPLAQITTRQMSAFLRTLDERDIGPRTVNKHRQLLSAIFNYACRADTYGLAANPVEATTKRREPPPAVLDFYEPEEIEALAEVAAVSSHRREQPADLEPGEIEWRAREDAQDAELFRLAAYSGLRLGELLALRWEDVDLDSRRMIVHRAVSAGVEGPTKSWRARFIPLADPASGALERLRARQHYTSRDDYVFCSRSGDAWTTPPCGVASSALVTPRAFVRCAFMRCDTPRAASWRATPTLVSCRSSSATRGSRPPNATCTRRRDPRTSSWSIWRSRRSGLRLGRRRETTPDGLSHGRERSGPEHD